MVRNSLIFCALIAPLVLAGCSDELPALPLDGGTPDRGVADAPAADAPTTEDCIGRPDGERCGQDVICVRNLCVASRCGDSFVDDGAGEQCEDGNEVEGDGCTLCHWDCTDDAPCRDDETCNGEEFCDLGAHRCAEGTPLMDGDLCDQATGDPGKCAQGTCIAPDCGNGIIDAGEDCDDQNLDPNDGCENDCSFSCTDDSDCDDQDPCSGKERCNQSDPEKPFCEGTGAVSCPSVGADCQATCDPNTGGCVFPDDDGDAVSCETDCDDKDAAIFPGADDCFDGKDNDCDSDTDDGADGDCKCYTDGDKDGYPPSGAAPTFDVICPEGTTRTPPGSGTTDCNDARPDVSPAQTGWFEKGYLSKGNLVSFDYNCDLVEEQRYTIVFSKCLGSGFLKCTGSGWEKEVPKCGVSGNYLTCSSDIWGLCTVSTRPTARVQTCH